PVILVPARFIAVFSPTFSTRKRQFNVPTLFKAVGQALPANWPVGLISGYLWLLPVALSKQRI
ncbi:MAG: hypothetical protein ACI92A_002393, partial [Candidatus Paceibacteria bacterium]